MCQYISMESFSVWLLKELKYRDITQSRLAQIAGLGSGTISNIMTGNRKVGSETLGKIAKALNIPIEEVFRAAGMLPPVQNLKDNLADRFSEILAELPEEDIDELYNIAILKLERKQRNK